MFFPYALNPMYVVGHTPKIATGVLHSYQKLIQTSRAIIYHFHKKVKNLRFVMPNSRICQKLNQVDGTLKLSNCCKVMSKREPDLMPSNEANKGPG